MFFSSDDITYRILNVDIRWHASIEERCDCQTDNRFIFFLRGCDSEYIIHGEKYEIANLTLLFIPKGCSWTHKGIREKSITISFFAQGPIPDNPMTFHSHIFVPYFRDISFSFTMKPSGYVAHCYSVFYTIVELIHNMNHETHVSPLYKTIDKGVDYLHRNFADQNVSIDYAASLCFLCVRRFRDLYKQIFGITPKQAIIELRIRRACELFQRENLSVREVSECCGFADVKHFSRTFHAMIHTPPSEYRDLFHTENLS